MHTRSKLWASGQQKPVIAVTHSRASKSLFRIWPSECLAPAWSNTAQQSTKSKPLEKRRYRAMLAGDTAVLDEQCSDDLIYTHSKADYKGDGTDHSFPST